MSSSAKGLARQTIGPVMVTSIEQTLLDLGAVLPAERLELAFDSALRQGRTRYERVVKHFHSFGGRGVPGSAALARLLDTRRPCPRPTHSELEVDFLQLTRAFGLSPAAGQFPVTLSNGRTVYIDFAYPGERLAIEVDSGRWHSGVRAIKWGNERQNLLVALGWRVLRSSGTMCSTDRRWWPRRFSMPSSKSSSASTSARCSFELPPR